MPRALWGKAPTVLFQHWSVFAAVVCSAALVAMAGAGGPLLRAAVESESLKAKLADLTPIGAGLTIETRRARRAGGGAAGASGTAPAAEAAGRAPPRRAAARDLGLRLPSTRPPIVTS